MTDETVTQQDQNEPQARSSLARARELLESRRALISFAGGAAGIVAFLAGLVLAALWQSVTDWLVVTLVIGGNLLFGVLLWWNRNQEHESSLVRRAMYGYMFFLSTALLAGALVFVNLLTYTYAREPFDLTRDSVYTISDQTINVLKNLKRPVKITVMYSSGHPAEFTIRELLDLYRKYSTKVKVEYIDPFRDRGKARELARAYPDITFPGVLVEYGEGDEADHMALKDSDLFSVNWEFAGLRANRQVENEFKGEDAISTAISHLTEGKQTVKIYFTSGYGQLDLNDSDRRSDTGIGRAKERLENLKWEVSELDLTKEKQVPDDATVVIVPGPKQRLPDAWIQALRDYMDRGGRMIVLADFAYDSVEQQMARTGLEGLLSDYNVELGDNRVLEAALSLFGGVTVTPQVITEPAAGEHAVVKGLAGMRVELYEARTVRPKTSSPPPGSGPSQEKYQAVTLLETTENAWAEADLVSRRIQRGDAGDEQGPVPVAVAVTEQSGPQTPPIPGQPPPPRQEEPRMVVIGDADFLSNAFYGASSDALFLNAVNWLRGRLDMLGIPPKEKKSLVLKSKTNAWALVWKPGTVMLVFLLCCGISVWVVRHNF